MYSIVSTVFDGVIKIELAMVHITAQSMQPIANNEYDVKGVGMFDFFIAKTMTSDSSGC
jgi:hypothetical protein